MLRFFIDDICQLTQLTETEASFTTKDGYVELAGLYACIELYPKYLWYVRPKFS
jgi:hypothetical protein